MQQKNLITAEKQVKATGSFLMFNISMMIIFPFLSVLLEHIINGSAINMASIGKWFIFWTIGIRLFTAGLRQASDPSFTAIKIFRLTGKESYAIIRELGFANICLGITGILSLINEEWRQISAIAGGLFFGLAGLQHLSKKRDSKNELIAMITDLFVFVFIIIYLALKFLHFQF
jgi:hypothetical protein